jgi:hypothetical protein
MKRSVAVTLFSVIVLSGWARAQENEIGFLAGATFSPDFHEGTSYEGVFGHRIVDVHAASLYLELPVIGITSREAPAGFSGGDFSSVVFTPALKLKVLPGSPLTPFLTAGVGLAHFNSTFTVRTGPFSGGWWTGSQDADTCPWIAPGGTRSCDGSARCRFNIRR